MFLDCCWYLPQFSPLFHICLKPGWVPSEYVSSTSDDKKKWFQFVMPKFEILGAWSGLSGLCVCYWGEDKSMSTAWSDGGVWLSTVVVVVAVVAVFVVVAVEVVVADGLFMAVVAASWSISSSWMAGQLAPDSAKRCILCTMAMACISCYTHTHTPADTVSVFFNSFYLMPINHNDYHRLQQKDPWRLALASTTLEGMPANVCHASCPQTSLLWKPFWFPSCILALAE